ncbi:transcription initiation factor IIB [Halopiger goleimassiliensis]|uniref:transcription initiation factor IIB n=1 Tax=Halopiger goleimassiliensis TaxID=1293048 RepID=UPI0009DBDB8F|nr:transcription initiation factor IIB family protein [Halopiger goleimassiliensis]
MGGAKRTERDVRTVSDGENTNGVERTCDECGTTLRTEEGETVCPDCGLVVSVDNIDHGPEWRCPDPDENVRRTGAPMDPSRHDRGLSTRIGYGPDSDGDGPRTRQLVRMRRLHNRARFSSKTDRNRAYGFTEIRGIVSALSLPASVKDQSCSLFESAQSEDLLCGRSIEGFAAGSVYAVCRVQSIARTIEEIVDASHADRDELIVAYDALNRDLGLPIGPISPLEYLPRYATELDLECDVEARAREYATSFIESDKLGGKNPSGVAAACLYMAAYDLGVDVSQTTAAEVADVSRMTIRSRIKELKELR